ncbi:MAG: DNA-3-methyladenine glycosylase I [Salinivirgaceae bacterium]
MEENVKRCWWATPNDDLYVAYHDKEWGVPVHDDQKLFEMLVLEGAQAGLSWATILHKRENYRRAFDFFQVEKVSMYGEKEEQELLSNSGIVRNKRKIQSAIKNARVFIDIQREFGSFDNYLWQYVSNQPIINHWRKPEEVPAETPLSQEISRDLKKRGMSFVGPTIIYAYMQSVGLVNDHLLSCFLRR